MVAINSYIQSFIAMCTENKLHCTMTSSVRFSEKYSLQYFFVLQDITLVQCVHNMIQINEWSSRPNNLIK